MKLSIIFATYKSENILEKSLKAYCNIDTQHKWELIIIDNADRSETRTVIAKYQELLPIVFIEKSEKGKNNALNKALPMMQGELVMFTDNDIIPESNIVDVYVEAGRKYPDISIFSGKILPDIKLPLWIDQSWHRIRSALGIYNKGESNLTIPAQDVWGGNMMLRNEIFEQGYSFNASIGPSGKNYIMGSETELLLKLEEAGYVALYVAQCIVFHQIREEQLTLDWLKNRAYRSGRGSAVNNVDDSITLFGYPRYLIRSLVSAFFVQQKAKLFGNKKDKCLAGMEYNFILGKLSQVSKKDI